LKKSLKNIEKILRKKNNNKKTKLNNSIEKNIEKIVKNEILKK